MQRVIELHLKTLERWERLEVVRVNVRVADGTDRPVRFAEALRMAASARCMAGKREARVVILTTVAQEARKRCVCLRVREL